MAGSYFEAVFPEHANVLVGKKVLSPTIKTLVTPLLEPVLVDLFSLCRYATFVYFQSPTAQNPSVFTNTYRTGKNDGKQYFGYKRADQIIRVLLGFVYADVSHRRLYKSVTTKSNDIEIIENSVDWYVQTVNPVDKETGEIDEELANNFLNHCKSSGYLCCLYHLERNGVGAIVSIPTSQHSDAVEIAKQLNKPFPNIKLEQSSLYGSVPLPLSITRNRHLCYFVDDLDGKKSLAALFAETLTEHDNSIPEIKTLFEHQSSREPVHIPHRTIKTDWVVERAFRQQLVEQVGEDKVILALIGLYLFSSFRNKEDETFAVVDTDTILQILNKKHSKKNLVSSNLKRLERLIPIETKRPFYIKSQATSFKIISPPNYMLDAQNQHKKPKTDPVLLSDGKSKTIKKAVSIENLKRTEESTNYPNEFSSKLISYLNNLPSNSFQARVNNSWTLMNNLADSLAAESKEHTLIALAAIQENPKPIYSQGSNTVRIYAARGHFQNLKRHIREEAFKDCVKLDLRHSQLSIAAKLIKSPLLLQLCESGKAWDYLSNATEMDKKSIKEFVYYVLFNDDEVIKEDELKADLRDCYRKLNQTPEIEEFLNLRTHYLIHNFRHETKDAFGNLLKGKMNQKFNHLISSIELSILSPGIDFLINDAKRTKIVLWLHDGFYLKGSDKETISNAKKTIEIVNQKAKDLNIPTCLIIEDE